MKKSCLQKFICVFGTYTVYTDCKSEYIFGGVRCKLFKKSWNQKMLRFYWYHDWCCQYMYKKYNQRVSPIRIVKSASWSLYCNKIAVSFLWMPVQVYIFINQCILWKHMSMILFRFFRVVATLQRQKNRNFVICAFRRRHHPEKPEKNHVHAFS